MKKILSSILIFFFIISCTNYEKNPSFKNIKELDFFNHNDTFINASKHTINQLRYYVVDESVKESDRDSLIKEYVDYFKTKNFDSTLNFYFLFYKESKITNLSHLKMNRKDIDRYSHENDLIWEYIIEKGGKHQYIYKYKSGEKIYPKSNDIIIVEDIK
ncbi:hypothetical protein [Sediminibacterium sp.]|uniref:hypothetical protein n=1 Tax=Sediminibacterium sp. TaxID=1917865 RepID=UPI003F7058AD